MNTGLKNYWPIDNHVNDTVGGAHMFNGYNVQYVNNRFGNPNSAIRFTDGYYQLPSGFYFRGDFTISLWLKTNLFVSYSNILEIGNGEHYVSIKSNSYSQFQPQLTVSSSYYSSYVTSATNLLRGQWTHLAVTLSGTTGSVYSNGMLVAESNFIYIPRYINRTSNFIGKDTSNYYGNIWSDLDDLRIYDRALSQTEIYDLMYYTSISAYVPAISTTTATTSATDSTNNPSTTAPSFPLVSSQTRYKNGLINHWPIDNHVNDTVSKANMYNGVNVEFVEDRFKIAKSAIRFSVGSYQLKPDVYFNGDFTISLWVRMLGPSTYDHRIISFTNDVSGDSIYLKFYYNQVSFYCKVSNSESSISSSIYNLYGQWTHIVATLSGSTGSIYMNGLLVAQSIYMYIPRYINRTSSSIGIDSSRRASFWADLDDLRIYNKSLIQSDVYNIFIEAPYNYEYFQSKFVSFLFLLNFIFNEKMFT